MGVVTRIAGWGALAVVIPVLLLALALRHPPRADFVVGNGNEPKSLDPAEASALPEGRVVRFLFEPLIVLDNSTLEPLPGAAASWESTADGLAWTFHLRSNGYWSDGHPVVARDFVNAFRRLVDPATGSRAAAYLLDVTNAREIRSGKLSADKLGIAAPSPSVLMMTLERRPADWLRTLAFPALVPVSIPASGIPFENGKPLISNGPFRVASRTPRDRIRLERNSFHRDASRWPASVDILACDSASTLLNMFLTGDVDWVTDIPPAVIAPLSRRNDGTLRAAPMSGTYFIRVNTRRRALGNRHIRAALDLSIDRRAMAAAALPGGELPASGLVAPLTDGWRSLALRDNVARARELLKQGLKEEGLTELPPLEYAYNTLDLHQTIAEVLQRQWQEALGIRVRLSRMENASLLAAVRSGDFDLARGSWIADHLDPTTFLDVFLSDAPNNQTGFADQDYDRAVKAAAALPPGAQRLAALALAEDRLIAASAVIPLYHYASYNLVSPRVDGFGSNPLDLHFPQGITKGR